MPTPAAAQMTADTDLDYMDEVANRALGSPPSPGAPAPPPEPQLGMVSGYIGRAAAYANMGDRITESERMVLLKRGVLRVAHLFTKDQVIFNDSVLKVLRALERRIAAVPTLLATAEADISDLADSVDRLSREVAELRRAVDECSARQEALAHQVAELRAGGDTPPS